MRTGILLAPTLVLACAAVPDEAGPRDPVTDAESAAMVDAGAAPHREVIIKSEGEKPKYTPAIRSGNFLFLSGAIGTAPEGGKLVPGGIKPETKRSLERIDENLKKAGLGLGDVVKCTVFLANIADYEPMNEVYREVWPGDPPTRTTVAVSGLALDAKIEIECLAAYPPGS